MPVILSDSTRSAAPQPMEQGVVVRPELSRIKAHERAVSRPADLSIIDQGHPWIPNKIDRTRPTGDGDHGAHTAERTAALQPAGHAKTIEGRQHPDCDAQFRHITERVREHQQAKCLVISMTP
jgi:hypothetical protein